MPLLERLLVYYQVLGPINGVAILLPFAYALGLPVDSALILLAAVYLGCEYGDVFQQFY